MSEFRGTEPWRSAAHSLLEEYDCRVARWRSSMTGCAWPKKRLIETPAPRSVKSFVIFAHEVGHVALEHKRSIPRWQQEVEAWEFALEQIRKQGLPGARKAQEWAEPRIAEAFWRALRRGADLADINRAAPVWWERSIPYLVGVLEA